MQNKQVSSKFSPQRRFISRREMMDLTGIAIPTLNVMAREHRGPVCMIPEGYSCNMYRLDDVLAWMSGEPIQSWPDADKQQTKRGKHLKPHRGPGRPRKRPNSSKNGGE